MRKYGHLSAEKTATRDRIRLANMGLIPTVWTGRASLLWFRLRKVRNECFVFIVCLGLEGSARLLLRTGCSL
jgi:hypothetical protein